MKSIIKGTYWLVSFHDKRWLTQGNKPTYSNRSYQRSGPGMGWLCLDEKYPVQMKDDIVVTSDDFKGLKFPKVKEDEEPIEIEISKSGKVYTYG